MKKCLALIFLCSATLATAGVANAAMVVIGSTNATVNHLTKNDVKAIYLDQPSDYDLNPLDQGTDSPEYSEFYKQLLNWSGSQIGSYWSSQVFSGQANPPQSVDNDKAAIAAVANSDDTIAYVDDSALQGYTGYKILYRFGGQQNQVQPAQEKLSKPSKPMATPKPIAKAKAPHFEMPNEEKALENLKSTSFTSTSAQTHHYIHVNTTNKPIIITNKKPSIVINNKQQAAGTPFSQFKTNFAAMNNMLKSSGNPVYFSQVTQGSNPNIIKVTASASWFNQAQSVKMSSLQTLFQQWQTALGTNNQQAAIEFTDQHGVTHRYNGGF